MGIINLRGPGREGNSAKRKDGYEWLFRKVTGSNLGSFSRWNEKGTSEAHNYEKAQFIQFRGINNEW